MGDHKLRVVVHGDINQALKTNVINMHPIKYSYNM
jgi:hypothetical protein